ncbi:MAG TPA: succinylglutamate desuccinylase/aspartoacylase family protein [Saprospiraceae bacterium]|nr:succinylglutamate desuccinylase/aspartoacylase family protein [Saprospiraceae bacterium]
MDRIIAKYTTGPGKPLLLCISAIHGNEPAGVTASRKVVEMLEMEPLKNPDFLFNGNYIGICGNINALNHNLRYINRDMNRMLYSELIESVKEKDKSILKNEELEVLEFIEAVNEVLNEYQPSVLYVLDLHTTSAKGGIFALPSEDPESLKLAKQLHAPVIRGFIEGIKGTTLHYFRSENTGIPTTAVVFEAGQHENPHSEDRCIAAIINCMRSMGCVKDHDVENKHDEILQEFTKYLPAVSHLSFVYKIDPDEQFIMLPGYVNFQPLKLGETLGYNKKGAVKSPLKGRILMPLYQNKGEDGFFIIQEEE